MEKSQRKQQRITTACFGAFLFFSFALKAQTVFEFTTFQHRQTHDRYLRDTIIYQDLQTPLTTANEYKWRSAFWAMELMLYKNAFTKEKLGQAWKKAPQTSESFQKALLEVSYTLYPGTFEDDCIKLMNTTTSPAVLIRCAEFLLLSNKTGTRKNIEKAMRNFAGDYFMGFTLLEERLNPTPQKRPPLKGIFAKDFLPNQTVIYSLQRSNRGYPGLVLIRKADGSFVRNADGSLFQTSQLARAITNYPFYITNGNTPQGIFRWTGFDTSSVDYIGPTANLQMVMPFEAKPQTFFGDSVSGYATWNKELYASLLPSSWKAYQGIYESFYAGLMGRSEIIMHGTTINPAYYKGQTYYPQTPSLGCLCSYEEWDKTGKRTVSNQQRIVEALNGIGVKNGYVVVIDLDDKAQPVKLTEVEKFLPLGK